MVYWGNVGVVHWMAWDDLVVKIISISLFSHYLQKEDVLHWNSEFGVIFDLFNIACPCIFFGDLLSLLKLVCISVKRIKFVQGSIKECPPLSKKWLLNMLTASLCLLPKHTWPITTRPRSKHWAKGLSCSCSHYLTISSK